MKLRITILKYHALVVFMPNITTNHAISYTSSSQSIFRRINPGLSAVQKIFKITYTAILLVFKNISLVRCAHWWNIFSTLEEKFRIFARPCNILFLFNGFSTMCNLKKRLIRAAFWILLQAMFMNDWIQTTQRLKLPERLLTIKKRNIIQWNIHRHKNFNSRRQVLKCL